MKKKSLYTVGPGGPELNLHPGQTRAWDSPARFIFVLAGSQGGKTSFGPWWLWREVYGDEECPGRGAGDYLAVTSTFDLFKLKMLPEMITVFCEVLKVGRFWVGDKVIELRDPESDKFWAKRTTDQMWGRIILRSANAKGGLEAATAKGAWLDEAGQDEFSIEAWEAILRRLALAEGRVLGTTTPYNLGWVKQQVYDPWLSGDPDFEVIQFSSILNPTYPIAEFKRARKRMPLWKFLMFYKGEFARPPGLIYNDYDDEGIQKIPPFAIPPSWPRYVGVDPSGSHVATLWAAENPGTGALYLYRETMETGKTTSEHVAQAKHNAEGENVVVWTGGGPSEEQQRRDWQSAGIFLREPKITSVWPQIDRVIELFKARRLFVFDTLVGLRAELGAYSRKLDPKTFEPTDEIKDKGAYHRLDALRYLATWLNLTRWDDIETPKPTPNPWNIEAAPRATNDLSWWTNR